MLGVLLGAQHLQREVVYLGEGVVREGLPSVRRTKSPQRQDTDVEFLFVRHRPATPDFRFQLLPHGVLAVLSENSRVQRVQDAVLSPVAFDVHERHHRAQALATLRRTLLVVAPPVGTIVAAIGVPSLADLELMSRTQPTTLISQDKSSNKIGE